MGKVVQKLPPNFALILAIRNKWEEFSTKLVTNSHIKVTAFLVSTFNLSNNNNTGTTVYAETDLKIKIITKNKWYQSESFCSFWNWNFNNYKDFEK